MNREEKTLWLLMALVTLGVMDSSLTYILIRFYGAVEANEILDTALQAQGFAGLLAAKWTLTVTATFSLWGCRGSRLTLPATTAAAVVYCLLVAYQFVCLLVVS